MRPFDVLNMCRYCKQCKCPSPDELKEMGILIRSLDSSTITQFKGFRCEFDGSCEFDESYELFNEPCTTKQQRLCSICRTYE